MASAGTNLKRFQLFRLLGRLRSEEFTGVLELQDPDGATRIILHNGLPRNATSDKSTNALAAFLLRKKRIRRETLTALVDESKRDQERFQQLLVEREYMTAKEVRRIKRELGGFVFASAFELAAVPYELDPMDLDEANLFPPGFLDRYEGFFKAVTCCSLDEELKRHFRERWLTTLEKSSDFYRNLLVYRRVFFADDVTHLLMENDWTTKGLLEEMPDQRAALRQLFALSYSGMLVFKERDHEVQVQSFSPDEMITAADASKTVMIIPPSAQDAIKENPMGFDGAFPEPAEVMAEIAQTSPPAKPAPGSVQDDFQRFLAEKTDETGEIDERTEVLPFDVIDEDEEENDVIPDELWNTEESKVTQTIGVPLDSPDSAEGESPSVRLGDIEQYLENPSDQSAEDADIFAEEVVEEAQEETPPEPEERWDEPTAVEAEPPPAVETVPEPEERWEEPTTVEAQPTSNEEAVQEEEAVPEVEIEFTVDSPETPEEEDIFEEEVPPPIVSTPEASPSPSEVPIPDDDSAEATPEASEATPDSAPKIRPPAMAYQDPPTMPEAPRNPEPGADQGIERILEDVYGTMLGRSLYQILGVTPNSSLSAVRESGARLQSKYSEDQYRGFMLSSRARLLLDYVQAEIRRAVAVLTEPEQRRLYDARIGTIYPDEKGDDVRKRLFEAEKWYIQGRKALKNDQLAEALGCYARASSINPTEPEYLSSQGWAVFLTYRGERNRDRKKLDEAVSLLRKALQVEPRHIRSMLFMARVLRELGKREDALAWYERIQKQDPSNREAVQSIQDLRRWSASEDDQKTGAWGRLKSIFSRK